MKLKQRETGRQGVMRACLDLLAAEKLRHWRMNSGDRYVWSQYKKYRIRGHAKGTPDILVAVPMRSAVTFKEWYYYTALVWIETKPTDGKASAAQLDFRDDAIANGEIWILIDDPTKLQDWLKENRAR